MQENKKKEEMNNDELIKLLCYLGIFVLLMFIVLPPLFRVLFPEEEAGPVIENKETIMNLNCIKMEDFDGYSLKTTIDSTYVNSKINNSVFTYEVSIIDDDIDSDEIVIEEYEKLKRVNNTDFEEEDNKYVLRINYKSFDYSDEDLLFNHQKLIVEQLSYYTDNDFECATKSVE